MIKDVNKIDQLINIFGSIFERNFSFFNDLNQSLKKIFFY